MTINLNIPKAWDLLSESQFYKVCTVLNTAEPSKLQQIRVFFALIGVKWFQFRKIRKAFSVLRLVPLSELRQHYSYIYHNDHVVKFLSKVRIGFRYYYGPKTALRNITIEDFAITEDAFFMYHKTQNIDYLRVIACVLYRRKRNGKRIDFDKLNIDEYIKPFKKLNPKKLLCIALSYKGSSLYIQSKYKNVFKRAKESQKIQDINKLKKPSLFKIVIDMAGNKFGTLNETKTTNIHDFLTELNNLLKPKQ